MVIPVRAPKVAHLVDHRLEPVVHCLRLFSFVEDESTEFTLDCFALGDFGHLVPLMCRLEDIPNFFSIFNPCTLLYSSRHKEARSIEVSWEFVTPGFQGHQDLGANIITRCARTKSHTYDESWHMIECHIFTT
jgi:hypothetical protein